MYIYTYHVHFCQERTVIELDVILVMSVELVRILYTHMYT